MTEEKEVPIILKEPRSSKAVFVDFKTEREEWNKYRLADGTLMRAKFGIAGFTMEESLDKFVARARRKTKPGQKIGLGLGLNSITLYAVESPPKLRGSPDSKVYPVEELRASIVKKEIDFDTVRATWNSYVLENGIRVKARISLISAGRTSKFDKMGMPVYLVSSGADIKVNMPEHVERVLRQRSKVQKTKKQ